MSEYGLSGSATYAVTFDTFDQLMDVLPDNDVQQITAQNMRNVVYTLWENGGGGGGSFSYTQTAPFSQGSVNTVGGIGSGTTFSNVSLQDLFDRMFFPAVGGAYTISTSPAAIEFNNPSNKTDVIVSITRKNPSISQITVSNGQGGFLSPPPAIPANFNDNTSKTYEDVTVIPNTKTTYTLTVVDSTGTKTPEASVTWFFPRWYGSIDLINPNLNAGNFGPSEKTEIINLLKGGDLDWAPVWNNSSRTSFKAASGQLSGVTVIPKNTNSCHIILIWPEGDYGDGDPSGYTFGVQAGRPFIDLGEWPVENQYGNVQTCRIWIKDFKSAGTESFTINN